MHTRSTVCGSQGMAARQMVVGRDDDGIAIRHAEGSVDVAGDRA